MTSYNFKLSSENEKTGPIPVTMTSKDTCPTSCPFQGSGCYAEQGILSVVWRQIGKAPTHIRAPKSINLEELCDHIAALPAGQLWRHNQAGDLPGVNETIDTAALAAIADANRGKRGFTYTHKPMNETNLRAVVNANAAGFTVNLSANNLTHADQLAETGLPIVVVQPKEYGRKSHQSQWTETLPAYRERIKQLPLNTPAGNAVVVCPATYRDDVTCKSCGLCQRADRPVIVGFPADGCGAKKATVVARS
jgi:hypothetical protein